MEDEKADERRSSVPGSARSSAVSHSGSSITTTTSERPPGLARHASRVDTILSTTQSGLARLRSNTARNRPFSHPLGHVKTEQDVIVDFDGPDDPYRPINWPFKKKVITTLLYGLTTMGSTWASSVYSPGVQQVAAEFHVGLEVSILGLSLLLIGFGLGPLLWAPISEVYGRKPAVLVPYFLSAVFSFATATSKDIQTVLITRFFCGFFGSAPVTNTGGVLGDIWSPQQRGAAIVAYSAAVVVGPLLGPIAGSAIVVNLGWRWTEYITGIIQLVFLFFDVLLLDESYPNVLLVYKARRLRYTSGNWALHARHEEWDISFRDLAEKFLVRPFQMLATPICFFVAVYASFCYGIVYLNFAAFPIAFEEERGWGQVIGSLPFLAVLVGTVLGMAVNIVNQKFYIRRFEANNNRPVPEARLPPMMFGSFFFAAGLFIFGWTSDKHTFWFGQTVGAACLGLGFLTIFQGALNYLIDTFAQYGASAIAANTFLRSIFAAAFPLFANPMFHNLGIPWATSLLGFIAVAMIPIPFVFYIYGRRFRAMGKWSRPSTL